MSKRKDEWTPHPDGEERALARGDEIRREREAQRARQEEQERRRQEARRAEGDTCNDR